MRVELVRGTLDMLILKALSGEAKHGYGVARWLEEQTDDALRVEEGSLYPALRRLVERGWVQAEWGYSENNRKARYYRLTGVGRRRLREEAVSWGRFVAVVSSVMEAAV